MPKQVLFRCPDDLYDELQRLGRPSGITVQQVIKDLLESSLAWRETDGTRRPAPDAPRIVEFNVGGDRDEEDLELMWRALYTFPPEKRHLLTRQIELDLKYYRSARLKPTDS